ncbi:OmpA family protein [Pedobacter insulae]|uniref:OmpA family protein n=1 Tax=Pedobacter insulae TaxID=414048 RepID=A0A1I2XGQ4_9SPHI|nr:OmpA family protein [Pedobacter insulae]SFH12625.1 OmpA family protein [Pedobacter insulae]
MKTRMTLIACAFAINFAAVAQVINPKETAKRKVEERTNRTTDRTIDKGLDKLEKGIGSIFKKKDKDKKEENSKASTNSPAAANETVGNSSSATKSNSKFDFVPGNKVIGFDDFSSTDVGDFPLGWNTNSSAEIVTFANKNQKWLSITKDGYFQPNFVTDMPENFTLEMDVFTRYRSNNILQYQLYIAPSADPRADLAEEHLPNYFRFNWLGSNQKAGFYLVEDGKEVNKNEGLNIEDLVSGGKDYSDGMTARVSIWRQKSRLRIYINQNKVLDIPQAFNPSKKYNVFKIGAKYMNYSTADHPDEFMVANIRYAVAGEDTRTKLLTEGKFVTNEILFDVNSDKIKAESTKIITEIGNLLAENPSVKLKIVGHTDSDGDGAANLALSKKRAQSVKTRLAYGFGIDESRLLTDGKGEGEPVTSNNTAEGKAQNRRVEFIKL